MRGGITCETDALLLVPFHCMAGGTRVVGGRPWKRRPAKYIMFSGACPHAERADQDSCGWFCADFALTGPCPRRANTQLQAQAQAVGRRLLQQSVLEAGGRIHGYRHCQDNALPCPALPCSACRAPTVECFESTTWHRRKTSIALAIEFTFCIATIAIADAANSGGQSRKARRRVGFVCA
jgi:hypothetical protein